MFMHGSLERRIHTNINAKIRVNSCSFELLFLRRYQAAIKAAEGGHRDGVVGIVLEELAQSRDVLGKPAVADEADGGHAIGAVRRGIEENLSESVFDLRQRVSLYEFLKNPTKFLSNAASWSATDARDFGDKPPRVRVGHWQHCVIASKSTVPETTRSVATRCAQEWQSTAEMTGQEMRLLGWI